MKYDVVIIGGGLAALASGIRLQEAGLRVCIISAGQSALHFCSGSFEMLGYVDDQEVTSPREMLASLPPSHPYVRIGAERTFELLEGVKSMLAAAGLTAHGTIERNHYRLTPLGYLKPAWLTLDDYITVDNPSQMPWKQVSIVNLDGYIDFYPRFLALGLGSHGVRCHITNIDMPQLRTLRKSTTEMRATNIARVLQDDAIDEMARLLIAKSRESDAIVMPAVIGLYSEDHVKRLRREVGKPLYFVPTMPASVPGVRCQLRLRQRFERLGGTYLLGDTVQKADLVNDKVERVYTSNLGDMPLEAEAFVMATGTFFSYGLVADMDKIYEPVMGLDINVTGGRSQWYDKNLYKEQPYMSFGLRTDELFRPLHAGKPLENLYAAGSVIGGVNALKEGSGAGITLATALHVADMIAKNLNKTQQP